MATKREAEARQRRYADAKEVSDKQTSGFVPSYLKLGKYPFFQFRAEKKYRIVVLPYEAGKLNPNCDEGLWTYELSVRIHGRIGPSEQNEICPFSWNESPCFVHDFAAKHKNNELRKTSHRQVMAIVDLDEKDKGIQIFEGPFYFGFGEKLKNKIDASDPDSPIRKFYHLEHMLKFYATVKNKSWKNDKTGAGGTRKEIIDLEYEALPSGIITEKTLARVPNLEDLVTLRPYAEQKKLFLQSATKEDDEKAERNGKPGDDDDGPIGGEDDDSPVGSGDDDDDVTASSDEDDDEKKKDEDDDDGGIGAEDDDGEKEDDDESPVGGDEEEEDEDEKPKGKKGGGKTAKDLGLAVDMLVTHSKHGDCEILRLNPEGTEAIIEDDDGKVIKGVPVTELKPKKTADAPKPSGKKPDKKPGKK